MKQYYGEALLSPGVVEISVPEVVARDDEIGIQSSSGPEFLNGPVPITVQGIGVPEIVVGSRFRGRFVDRVRPEQEPILVEQIPLMGQETQ